MPEWYNLTLIQKAIVLAIPACIVIGIFMNANGKNNNSNSGGQK